MDNGEGTTAATVNGSPDLIIAANGDWSYDLNETLRCAEPGAGDTLGDTLTVTSDDGTEQDITITITGVNDAATLVAHFQSASMKTPPIRLVTMPRS